MPVLTKFECDHCGETHGHRTDMYVFEERRVYSKRFDLRITDVVICPNAQATAGPLPPQLGLEYVGVDGKEKAVVGMSRARSRKDPEGVTIWHDRDEDAEYEAFYQFLEDEVFRF